MQKFNVKEALLFGWHTYKKNWKFFFILFLMVWGAYAILSWIVNAASDVFPLLGAVAQLVVWAAESVIGIGLVKIAIDFVTNKTPDYKDMYRHYALFWNYIAGSILYGLIVLGGLILLIIPGIYFAIKYYFVIFLVVDKRLGPIEALKKSAKITQGSNTKIFLLGLALFVINCVGFLTLIGLLVTVPITLLTTAFVYKKLT